MSAVQMTTARQSREEDWIKKFDPNKRFLRGRAYLVAKRLMDLFLVVITLPLWLPLNGIIALIINFTATARPWCLNSSVPEREENAFTCTSSGRWCPRRRS
jgi:hypothetical protein